MLGWCPKDNRELFSLAELREAFDIGGISKSPSIFDYDKLAWFNAEYLRHMDPADFLMLIQSDLDRAFAGKPYDAALLAELLQPRLNRLSQIPDMIRFLTARQDYPLDLFFNKKNKVSPDQALTVLPDIIRNLSGLENWSREAIHDCLMTYAADRQMKTGQIMWPVRIAVSGLDITPGGAIELAVILGRQEALERLQLAAERLSKELEHES